MVRDQEWVEKTFGRFAWRDDAKQRGRIEILGEWERQNIVSFSRRRSSCGMETAGRSGRSAATG